MNKNLIKLLLVDNHVLFRKGLKAIISEFQDFEIIGDFSDLEDCLSLIRSGIVDIVVIDTDFTMVSFVDLLESETDHKKPTKFIALTFADSLNESLDVISSGVDGYLLKNEEIEDLIMLLRKAYKGEFVLSDKLTINVINLIREKVNFPFEYLLSEREMDVMRLIFSGYSNKQISQELFLSENTIKTHLKHIYHKFSVKNRKEAILKAKMWGIFR